MADLDRSVTVGDVATKYDVDEVILVDNPNQAVLLVYRVMKSDNTVIKKENVTLTGAKANRFLDTVVTNGDTIKQACWRRARQYIKNKIQGDPDTIDAP